MKYMIVAGEASGDLHASRLMKEIKATDKEAEFRFLGGDLMSQVAGREPEIHIEKMNVMGFTEVIKSLPVVVSNLKRAKALLKDFHPNVLILVDYPSFNLKLAAYAHKLGIRVDWMIAPKVWAWKEWRIPQLKKYLTNLYSILPFETAYFKKHGMDVRYVGNPTVKEVEESLGHIPPKKHFLDRQGISDTRPIIAILPGSRRAEIRNNLPLMIEAAKKFPEYQYIIAAAPSVPEKFYRSIAQDAGLQLAFGATHTLLKYSTAAIVTSGTATLETAVIGTPQVVCYRGNGSRITYEIMKKILKVKYVSLPNLIVGNNIVTELLLHNCTSEKIARALGPLLQPSPQRDWQLAGYRNMKKRLGTTDASKIAAEYICKIPLPQAKVEG
ncbi:MAG: lipid-A-disaccharide synthase [Muribaculaceae bacterium]|nr:lipid-A-disaccharide synthase [Muribaculaceae bacterium]